MKLAATELAGVYELELEPHEDQRGFFARLYCPQVLESAGIAFTSTQINLSRNTRAHTLRGMHFQAAPYAEAKIVRAVRGALFDVVVDLRPESASRFRWIARTLTATRGNALFVPEGFAHGFMTLEDDTDVLYQMGSPYVPGRAGGFRYDDRRTRIVWPHPPAVIAEADETWPAL